VLDMGGRAQPLGGEGEKKGKTSKRFKKKTLGEKEKGGTSLQPFLLGESLDGDGIKGEAESLCGSEQEQDKASELLGDKSIRRHSRKEEKRKKRPIWYKRASRKLLTKNQPGKGGRVGRKNLKS